MTKEKAYSYSCDNCTLGFISTVEDNKVCPHCNHNNIDAVPLEGEVDHQ